MSQSYSDSIITRFLLLALLLSQLVGCSQEEKHRLRTYREGSVSIIETTGGPMYQESLFKFEPILTLEQDPEHEESLFYYPGEFTVSTDGLYFVLDFGKMSILAFDSAGKYVRSFGRKGEGPGEFESPTIVAVSGDTLVVFDRNHLRTTRFRTDGSLLDIVTAREFGRIRSLLPITGEKAIITTGRTEYRGNYMYRGSDLLVVDIAGTDTLASVSTGLVQGGWAESTSFGERLITTIPFVGQPTVRYVPGRGILATDGDKPEISWYNLQGKLQTIIRLGLAERPITSDVKKDYEARAQRFTDESAARRGRPSRPMGEMHYPTKIAYWSYVIVDDAGFIWLQDVMMNPLLNVEPPWISHVISPEGRYLGTTELPARTPQIMNGILLALIRDPETGEQSAVVYRIVPAVDGLKYPTRSSSD